MYTKLTINFFCSPAEATVLVRFIVKVTDFVAGRAITRVQAEMSRGTGLRPEADWPRGRNGSRISEQKENITTRSTRNQHEQRLLRETVSDQDYYTTVAERTIWRWQHRDRSSYTGDCST